eukprot:TRINITY_DN3975_c0_g1_i4.p1 TRINITY_DN3975_c0_g1~~TRINITY_DN3975_c0_g1_i4.p1  ORF type:complete len:678 (-),score=122.66 TRINITY_DN3975_c0_g1_i4:27-2009(-)
MSDHQGGPSAAAVTASDVGAAMHKYKEERDKRIRRDATTQYMDEVDMRNNESMKHFLEDPWVPSEDPLSPAPARPLQDGARTEVLILGAGYGGLLYAVRLQQAGVLLEDITIIDSAGDFGGTWYWNRYPGLMCDVESYIYMPLLEETGYMPKHKYAYGSELREQAERVADKFNLRDRAIFQSTVDGAVWSNEDNEWVVSCTERRKGRHPVPFTIRATFLITASGLLHYLKVPKFDGLDEFKGRIFHTSRWDFNCTGGSPTDPHMTKLADKKVGIIGTGATAIQAVPQLAKSAKELYVFQRTPSSVDVRGQEPTDPAKWAAEIAHKKGWQRERALNFSSFLADVHPKPDVNMVNDAWTRMPAYSALIGNTRYVKPEEVPSYIGEMLALDLVQADRIRARVDTIVQDPDTASKLKAWYPVWCKRPTFHDDYLPTFNLPHVTLVDTNGKGVDKLTPTGVVVDGKEYAVDVLILSTGFRSPTASTTPGAGASMPLKGRSGRTIEEHFHIGGVSTLFGMMSRDFPNLFWPGVRQASVGVNVTFILDFHATTVAQIIANAAARSGNVPTPARRHNFTLEPTLEAQHDWGMRMMAGAAKGAFILGCTPSYLNMEGAIDQYVMAPMTPEEQVKAAKGGAFPTGLPDYVNTVQEWIGQADLKGIEVKSI